MAHSSRKLEFVDTGNEVLEFGEEAFDSVEDAFGICLLGFVVNGRPPTAAIVDLVRRWGTNIKFQTHESGWITFTFPSAEVKERILSGGTHMVYGFHLFLKEMPRYFKEEDMQTLPSWVQIHGLPPVGWNHHVLSRIASKIGQPIHMDMMTQDRKRVQYARVLVEMDVTKPPLQSIKVGTPVGALDITFVYEKDANLCTLCNKVGHVSEDCQTKHHIETRKGTDGVGNSNEQHRGRSRSVVWRREGSRGRSRIQNNKGHAISRSRSRVSMGMKNNNENIPSSSQKNHDAHKLPENGDGTVGQQHTGDGNMDTGMQAESGKGKKIVSTVEIEMEQIPMGKEDDGYTKVSNKKSKKKNKKKSKKQGEKKQGMDEDLCKFLENMADSSSCDTEYVVKNQQQPSKGTLEMKGRGGSPNLPPFPNENGMLEC